MCVCVCVVYFVNYSLPSLPALPNPFQRLNLNVEIVMQFESLNLHTPSTYADLPFTLSELQEKLVRFGGGGGGLFYLTSIIPVHK